MHLKSRTHLKILGALLLSTPSAIAEETPPATTSAATHSHASPNASPNASGDTSVKASPTASAGGAVSSDEVNQLKITLLQIQDRLTALEQKIQTTTVPITLHPSQSRGNALVPNRSKSDPELGYTLDSAVMTYRNARLPFEAGDWAVAEKEFSSFLEQFGDHPLAGHAALHHAETFLNRKDFKKAKEALLKLIQRYDRSSAISFAFQHLVTVSKELGKKEEADRNFQILTTFYPSSPAVEPPPATAPVGTSEFRPSSELHTSNSNTKTPALDSPPPAETHSISPNTLEASAPSKREVPHSP